MKKIIFPIIAIVVSLLNIHEILAQGGGFGHFSAGFAGAGYKQITKDLSSPSLLGEIQISGRGTVFGGGGYGLIGKHLLLGGKGYGAGFGKVANANGEVEMGQAYGFFNFGYMATPWKGFFPYIFGGVGGGGASMTIKNNSGNTFDMGGLQIKSGEKVNLSVGGSGFEVGAGIHHFFGGKYSGVKLGLEAGYSFTPLNNQWGEGDAIATTLSKYSPGMTYITVTIGGGKVVLE